VTSKKIINPEYKKKFIEDLRTSIVKTKSYETLGATTCETIFSNDDNYSIEKKLLSEIDSRNFSTTKDQGDALENLIKNLFNRIQLLDSITITKKDTALGQLDLQIATISDYIYDVLGMSRDKPDVDYIIGECKNYKDPVGREEIERVCWRASKGSCLAFFISTEFTQPAIDEIKYFNMNKEKILIKAKGVYIIPLSIAMIKSVVENNINFCYFIKWAISHSKLMSIVNYLKLN